MITFLLMETIYEVYYDSASSLDGNVDLAGTVDKDLEEGEIGDKIQGERRALEIGGERGSKH